LPFNYFNSRVEAAALTVEKYATSLEVVFERLGTGGAGSHLPAADGPHETAS
jgi:biopolymer transport protein ExbB